MYNFKILTEVDFEQWNAQLQKSNYSTFFQTAEYLYTEKNSEYFPIFILIEDKNQNVVGQLGMHIIKSTVLYSSTSFQKLLKIMPSLTKRGIWVYGPIIHSTDKKQREEILQTIITAISSILKKYDLVFVEGYSPPNDLLIDEEYKAIFKKNEYVIKDFVTYVTDLGRNMDEIWKDVSKKARGDVSRARRREIVSKEAETKDDLKKYLLLHQEWAKTKGLVVSEPLKELEKIWNNHQVGREKIFLAYKNNELISGLRIAIFNGIVYTHFVVSSYSEHTNLGGTLLTWNAIEWAQKTGLRYYDFSGGPKESGSDSEEKNSLLFYKRKWGGKEISHYNFTKSNKKITYSIYLLLFKIVRMYHDFKMREYKASVQKIEDDQ